MEIAGRSQVKKFSDNVWQRWAYLPIRDLWFFLFFLFAHRLLIYLIHIVGIFLTFLTFNCYHDDQVKCKQLSN
ncbi:unnamed protein product [Callosobruchus maculatus]|uniref:Uncharacterized protein n=1 Tax=Callosobruchus maculatus TaxID=64391 RepID=A0A653DKB2_CALMS|nr:unnamed protein product [Callosobruchus maculatus]